MSLAAKGREMKCESLSGPRMQLPSVMNWHAGRRAVQVVGDRIWERLRPRRKYSPRNDVIDDKGVNKRHNRLYRAWNKDEKQDEPNIPLPMIQEREKPCAEDRENHASRLQITPSADWPSRRFLMRCRRIV